MSLPSGSEQKILSGNELIVQGGLEAGFSLFTGYPGSPLADYFNILHKRSDELGARGIRVAIGNSESNAAAMAAGAKQVGRDALMAVKCMGLHVAADALAIGNYSNHKMPQAEGDDEYAAVVVVSGDDPWSMSTSMAADSRYLFKHMHIPFLEPATPQELKDWIAVARTLSRRSSVYQGILVNTEMAEGGGRVSVGSEATVPVNAVDLDPKAIDLSQLMVPPNSLAADVAMINERFPKVIELLRELDLDHQEGNAEAEIGIVSAGPVYETLKQVLYDLGLENAFALYKVAGSYPLVDDKLLPFIKARKELVVVEGKRGFLESEIGQVCQRNGLPIRIQGKTFVAGENNETGFPMAGGLNYELIRDNLCRLLDRLGRAQAVAPSTPFKIDHSIPRLPTFCPGCPHRETLSVLKDLRRTLNEQGVQLISHGDVGCYSLSFLEPFREMHSLSAMGQGGSNGAGIDMFSSNPSVVLMGDSTFFHSGMNAISNSVQLGHDITYILLKNDCTAMTGHQLVPNSGQSIEKNPRPTQNMLQLTKSLGVKEARAIHPSDRDGYLAQLQSMIGKPGTKVIISDKECGLTYYGRQRSADNAQFRAGKAKSLQHFYRINSAVCEDCRACVEMTGCPGLTRTEDAYGSKMRIDTQICVSDGYCSKIEACPSFEKVELFDYLPSVKETVKSTPLNLPEPERKCTQEQLNKTGAWRVVVSGVGGSGVTTITRVLAEAAANMKSDQLDFRFFDQKGMAQRNGRVTSHLALIGSDRASGPVTPIAQADLLLSTDLLDGSQSIGFLKPDGMAVMDQDFQTPLSMLLERGNEDAFVSAASLIEQVRTALGSQAVIPDAKHQCETKLGKRVYAAALILGVAYQQGCLPFSAIALKGAFSRSVPESELEQNWQAFQLGRAWVLQQEHETVVTSETSDEDLALQMIEESLIDSLPIWGSSEALIHRFRNSLSELQGLYPAISASTLAQFIHDILIYDRGINWRLFLNQAQLLAESFCADDLRLRALRILVRSYWIKDEMMVSHLLVTTDQSRDAELYQSARRYKVKHFNRLQVQLFGRKFSLRVTPPNGLLRIVRHWRWLRGIPGWHLRDEQIAKLSRDVLLKEIIPLDAAGQHIGLKQLESIKGYDEIRYQRAEKILDLNQTGQQELSEQQPQPV